MRVAAHGNVHAGNGQILLIVSDGETQPLVVELAQARYIRTVVAIVVVVAQHRAHRGDAAQVLVIHLRRKIAGMDNKVRTGDLLKELR